MSNSYTPGSNNGASNNSYSSLSRREIRTNNITGALAPFKTSAMERGGSSSFDFEQMIDSLRALFEHDRQVASSPDATRCGICYLHFQVSELHYRDEEGFYVCAGCEGPLSTSIIKMIRVQQKL